MTQQDSATGVAPVRKANDPADLYASLHRAIERGTADERTYCSLVRVCIELARPAEALEAYEQIESFGPKTRARTLLIDEGWLESDEESGKPSDRVAVVTTTDLEPTLPESVTDSLAFLVGGRIPVFAMRCIVTLGAVLGAGGLIHSLFGQAVATVVVVPVALGVIAWCAALAQRVFLMSCTGYDDPPELPEGRDHSREIAVAGTNLLVVALALLTPAVLISLLVGPGSVALFALGSAWALLPFVFAVRQLRDGWRETGPAACWRVLRARPQLAGVLAVNAVLFAPCALTVHYSMGHAAYLIACFVGMLGVVPLIASSRILGQVLYYQRDALDGVLDVRSAERVDWTVERVSA